MSRAPKNEPQTTIAPTVDRDEWSTILRQLRADGFSPVESIKATRAVLHVSLGEAKDIVHRSSAWADLRNDFEALHEAAESAAANL